MLISTGVSFHDLTRVWRNGPSPRYVEEIRFLDAGAGFAVFLLLWNLLSGNGRLHAYSV